MIFSINLVACSDKINIEKSNLKKTGSMELKYANQFSIDYYEEGYSHIHTTEGSDYVVVPEGKEDNSLGLSSPTYLHQPIDNVYLAATSAMDLFGCLDAYPRIATCSTKGEDYSIPEAARLIDEGTIRYVGKYSAPDYELILESKCGIAIESTMINHSPKVKEELEGLGIPVFIERSSYEAHPIGRLEWIKLYGHLLGKENEAKAFFDGEMAKLSEMPDISASDKKDRPRVAFFYITSNGYINVRKPGDYISTMLDMAGGSYALNDIVVDSENALSTMNINWEDFYQYAVDADILIYNSTIEGELNSLQDLLDKNPLFKDFKAVKNENVWCTGKNMFQESSKIAGVLLDLYKLINNKDETLTYLFRLK